jgi:two-component system, cell cycle sensor histidine kinase and response regulator CckA
MKNTKKSKVDSLDELAALRKYCTDLEKLDEIRRSTEDSLRESESNLKALLENTDGSIWSVDTEYRLIVGNTRFHRNTQNASGKDIEKGECLLRDINPAAFNEQWKGYYDRALEGKQFSVENTLRLYGEPCVMEYRFSPILTVSGRAIGVTVFGRDITERKRAENALRESEKKFSSVFRASPISLSITELESGRFLDVNETFLRLTEWSREEVIGRTSMELAMWANYDDRARIIGIITKKGFLHNEEVQFLTKSGNITSCIWSGETISLWGKSFLISVSLDITEKKRLQEQLSHARVMESVGRFAGGVAHEFNNLLTAILGNSEFALKSLSGNDPVREDIEEIRTAAKRAAELTRTILTFSRIQPGSPKVLDLDEVIREMNDSIRSIVGGEVEFHLRPSNSPHMVAADPNQIELLIENLVKNARDAMPEGGVLTIETENVAVDEHRSRSEPGTPPGQYVAMKVIDTGGGMEKAILNRIFEPFFTTKPVGRGQGLGLSTCYGIVRQNHGSIGVSSKPGRGSTFTVLLPAAGNNQTSRMAEGKTGAGADDGSGPLKKAGKRKYAEGEGMNKERSGETVLLVDDEPVVRSLLVRMLEMEGFRVIQATNGIEAMKAAEGLSGNLDLLITDASMPHMGGVELVERILPLFPGLKIIFMSGHTEEDSAGRFSGNPAITFMMKPFMPDDLLAKMREILKKNA